MTSRFAVKNDSDYYRAQSTFVGELVHFTKAYGVHVHLVAHPRKTKGAIEKEDISGSADINNRADNVFTVERTGPDSPFPTVVTILKNRSFGIQGERYGLAFHPISKRFWGWQDLRGEAFSMGWEPS
jgi:twinkle protein